MRRGRLLADELDAPTFADVCDQLLGVIDGRVFVGHNVNFDFSRILDAVR